MTYLRYIVAFVLLAVASFGVPSLPKFTGPKAEEIKEPTQAMKVEVSPVTKIVSKMNAVDRLWLQNIYKNAAKVVAADGIVDQPTITSTGVLRAVHFAVIQFVWKGLAENSPGEYEGLREAVDGVFNDVIGDSQKTMTPELRAKTVEMFEALAWAGLGKDG